MNSISNKKIKHIKVPCPKAPDLHQHDVTDEAQREIEGNVKKEQKWGAQKSTCTTGGAFQRSTGPRLSNANVTVMPTTPCNANESNRLCWQ